MNNITITQENINQILAKYQQLINQISTTHNYNDDITHLLYLIIPSFIIKYGLLYENDIKKTFQETPIILSNKDDKNCPALYTSIPHYKNNQIQTKKFIILNNYQNTPLVNIIDSIIHEYNHAINSHKKEITEKNNQVYIRTGLSHIIYNKDLTFNNKTQAYILEEIINTKQTEEIMEIIYSFQNFHIQDHQIQNTIYAIKNSINQKYTSEAYLLQTTICKDLLNNRTFLSTLSKLRFQGEISDIEYWFDNIIGEEKSYQKLIELLTKTVELEHSYAQAKFFKKRKLLTLRQVHQEALEIINRFQNHCNLK